MRRLARGTEEKGGAVAEESERASDVTARRGEGRGKVKGEVKEE